VIEVVVWLSWPDCESSKSLPPALGRRLSRSRARSMLVGYSTFSSRSSTFSKESSTGRDRKTWSPASLKHRVSPQVGPLKVCSEPASKATQGASSDRHPPPRPAAPSVAGRVRSKLPAQISQRHQRGRRLGWTRMGSQTGEGLGQAGQPSRRQAGRRGRIHSRTASPSTAVINLWPSPPNWAVIRRPGCDSKSPSGSPVWTSQIRAVASTRPWPDADRQG